MGVAKAYDGVMVSPMPNPLPSGSPCISNTLPRLPRLREREPEKPRARWWVGDLRIA